jgi:tetratricopeptide (TPR) repeat protein
MVTHFFVFVHDEREGCMKISLAQLVGATCLVVFSGCAALTPKSNYFGKTDGEAAINTMYNTARMHEHQNELDKARAQYLALIAKHPQHGDSYHRLGVMSIRQGDVTQGIQFLRQAQMWKPADDELQTDLGYALFLDNRLDESAKLLQQVVDKNPANKRAANNLGLVLGRQGLTNESLAVFRQAGSEATAHANMGFVYAQLGELDKAEQHFSKALDHDRELYVAAEGLIQLTELRKQHAVRDGTGAPVSATRDVASRQRIEAKKAELAERNALSAAETKTQAPQTAATPNRAPVPNGPTAPYDKQRRTNIATAHFSQPSQHASQHHTNQSEVRLTGAEQPVPRQNPPQAASRAAQPLW